MTKETTMYEHNGIKIAFDPKAGTFSAMVSGKRVVSDSLAAMKKRITKAALEAFEPFSAIRIEEIGYGVHGKLKIASVQIVGTEKARGSYAMREWEDDKGRHYRKLALDTPQNRAAMQALIDHRMETNRIKIERDKVQEKLFGAVKEVAPPDA